MHAPVKAGAQTVELVSPSGLLSEAMQANAELRAAYVSTVVSGHCSSACTILFLGALNVESSQWHGLAFTSGALLAPMQMRARPNFFPACSLPCFKMQVSAKTLS